MGSPPGPVSRAGLGLQYARAPSSGPASRRRPSSRARSSSRPACRAGLSSGPASRAPSSSKPASRAGLGRRVARALSSRSRLGPGAPSVASAIAVVSVALAVSGLGAAVRASAHSAQLQAVAAAATSTSGGRGLLPAVPPHPPRPAGAAVPASPPPAPAPPAPAPPAAAPPAPAGPMPVAQLSLPLVDTSRRAGSGPRVLTTSVWYPAAPGGPFPLVVFAHGYNVTPAPYAGLLQSWARAGYVVAAPTFPLTNPGAPGGPNEDDVVNQPADVRFVIDRLLAADAQPGPLAGLINP